MKKTEACLWDIMTGKQKANLLSQAIQVEIRPDRADIQGMDSLIRVCTGDQRWKWEKDNDSIKNLVINWIIRRPYDD